MSSKCIASTIASTVDINQLEELYYDSYIGQLDMLSFLQSTTLKVLHIRSNPSEWRVKSHAVTFMKNCAMELQQEYNLKKECLKIVLECMCMCVS